MVEHFVSRGHRRQEVEEALEKAKQTSRSDLLTYKPKVANSRTPLIVTHHPSNPPLRSWLRELQGTLHASDRLKRAIPEPPILGERNSKSLRNLLMPSSLPAQPDPHPVGFYKCTKRCVLCQEHCVESKTFSSHQTKESFHIRHYTNCQTENIIYLLFCDLCDKSQYVGETKNSLKTRFYLHRSHIKKNTGTLITRHFNQPSHAVNNMKCMIIEKVLTHDYSHRIAREKFWINKLQTLHPQGLNVLE